MKKSVKIPIMVVAVLVIALGATVILQKNSNAPSVSDKGVSSEFKTTTEDNADPAPESSVASKGRYTGYGDEEVAKQGYPQTIVFFYAPWCPECRAFKKAITEGQIPDGVQILETDFDNSTDLKKKYGVTLQSTFVRVDSSGELQKKWVGYGREKSLALVLESVK